MTERLLHTNFERCCRLCAEEQDVTIMIFSQEAEAMLLQNKLIEYLLIENMLATFQIEKDDKLPKNICIQCCTKLQTVCDFIDTARKAQDILLTRSLNIEEIITTKFENLPINQDSKSDQKPKYDDNEEYNQTKIEVNVDPMMILPNSEDLSPENYDEVTVEDVTYLHSVDAENVTIKLIKKDEKKSGHEGTSDTPKPYTCITCKRGFNTDIALRNHSWQHITVNNFYDKYRCMTCNKCFYYKKDLIIHLKQHQTSGVCQLCGRMFRSEKNYIDHMSMHLPVNKSYPCKICGRIYNTWAILKSHTLTHSTERPYQCHICKKSFKRNQDLKFHINQHTGAKPYKCPFCDKRFASSGNCYSHRSRMHAENFIEEKEKIWNSTPKTKPPPIVPKNSSITDVKGVYKYQCELCNASFLRRDNFTYHMYQHTGEKPFKCSFCSEKFVTRRGLLLHHDKEHLGKSRPLALLSKNTLL